MATGPIASSNPQWNRVVLNRDELPHSDIRLSSGELSPPALAARDPYWIVVSDAYSDDYLVDEGDDAQKAHSRVLP